jgi:hypothetical protein
MRNWAKYHAAAADRSRRASRAAQARWDAYHAAMADEPVRQTRVIEMVVVDSHRPRRRIRLEANETARGWGRWKMTENGVRIGKRRFGESAVGKAIARSLM